MDSAMSYNGAGNGTNSLSVESNEATSNRPLLVVELSEDDIPGAHLSEPLESHNVQALKWWLLCRGIKAPTTWKKSNLISRIVEAKEKQEKIVDVDGSYLYLKQQKLISNGISVESVSHPPPSPMMGWETVNAENYKEYSSKIPKVTQGDVYVYMAKGVGASQQQGAFRALSRGYIHWKSGRINTIEVNLKHPNYCHVKCLVKPSMKQGVYHVYLLLQRNEEHGNIVIATCQCAAGLSASCTHVSALLHALSAMNPVPFPSSSSSTDDTDEQPVTSLTCTWNQPRKRKESNLKISDVVFEKHVHGKTKKNKYDRLEDFDPRPEKYHNTATNNLVTLLDNLRGQGLCISLLFDARLCVQNGSDSLPTSSSGLPHLPDRSALQKTVTEFIKSLQVTEE